MTGMRVEKLTLEQAQNIYEIYAREDFPPEEIKEFSVIRKRWEQTGYYAYAFYGEGQEPWAYAFLTADLEKRVLLLDYFAVTASNRGRGCGSAALNLLRDACAEWDALVIEVEDDELENIDEETCLLRKRRIAFYRNAGCSMTTVRSRVWGVDYRIMTLPLAGQSAEKDLPEKLCSVYRGLYSEEVLQKQFMITAR